LQSSNVVIEKHFYTFQKLMGEKKMFPK
jgi:hypothetical protein